MMLARPDGLGEPLGVILRLGRIRRPASPHWSDGNGTPARLTPRSRSRPIKAHLTFEKIKALLPKVSRDFLEVTKTLNFFCCHKTPLCMRRCARDVSTCDIR